MINHPAIIAIGVPPSLWKAPYSCLQVFPPHPCSLQLLEQHQHDACYGLSLAADLAHGATSPMVKNHAISR